MTVPTSANDLLFAGGGAPALQWAHPDTQQDYPVGTSYEGEVVKTSAVRQRDLQDKSKLAVWPDGSPKYVAIVTLQTGLADPQVEQDSGLRSLWVSGKYLTNAVKDAVKKTGSHEIEEGGWLKVTLSGYGKPQTGFRPPRLFEVVYRRPSPEKRAEIQARKDAEAQAAQRGIRRGRWVTRPTRGRSRRTPSPPTTRGACRSSTTRAASCRRHSPSSTTPARRSPSSGPLRRRSNSSTA
jgi:hypothetical protein